MIIVPFSGGLGNQLFQYAFSCSLSRQNPSHKIYYTDYLIRRNPAHNGYELAYLFGITLSSTPYVERLTRFSRKVLLFPRFKPIVSFLLSLARIYVREESRYCSFDVSFMTARKGVNIYIGYWQTALYFQSITDEIVRKFTFDMGALSQRSREMMYLIERSQSVSVHIRRGDYLSPSNVASVGTICDLSYYRLAMEYMRERLGDVCFFIFSDDVAWAVEHIRDEKIIVISGNDGKAAWQDMCLMSKCRHHIIANSTFSWWGAWLGRSEDKLVVAPSRFSKDIVGEDLIPSSWIRI